MSFAQNIWYVAAWSREVGTELFSRRICNQPLLLYRGADGGLVVLHDECPHRFAPLHMGKIVEGGVECPYHGLVFGADGACTRNPHGHIPKAARVATFSAIEKHSLIWVWFGDPSLADEELIPDFSFLVDDERHHTVGGVFTVAAHYELITDNLMDLSHAAFLHRNSLGNEEISRGKHTVHQHGTTLFSNRWCPSIPAPPAWRALFNNYDKPVDHWIDMRWDAPAHMLLDVGITPAGRPRSEGVASLGTDILTPETEKSTHYFWGATRDFRLEDEVLDEITRGSIEQAFIREDLPMLEAVQRQMGDHQFDDLKPLLFPFDEGAVRARRLLKAISTGKQKLEIPATKQMAGLDT